MPLVSCRSCRGTGRVELPKPLQQTLRALRHSRTGLRLGEIRAALAAKYGDIPWSTVSKRLGVLMREGAVERNGKLYRLTPTTTNP